MADRHTNDAGSNDSLINRRSYMKLTGAATAVAGSGMIGSAVALDDYSPETVVDLGEQGLSNGDVIDPYLDEYFDDGVEVHVPAGTYTWNGRGFHRGANANAAIIGQGEVILESDGSYRNTIRAEAGVIAIKNLTVWGKVSGSRNRLEAAEGAKVLIDNWNFPDGSTTDGVRSRPFYVPPDHAGEVEFRNCYFKGFDDNGIYATSPGKGEGGRVVVDNCFAHNCNVAGIRIGGRGSVVRNCVILNDDSAPLTSNDSRNQRGIRIGNYEHSQDMLIKNVDIIHSGDDLGGGAPIRFSKDSPLSTGHMENIRIYNANGVEAIAPKRHRAEGWTGSNIQLTGDGNLDVPDWFENVCVGSDCEEPSSEWSSDGATGGQEDFSNGGLEGDELVLVTDDSDGISYQFTADDVITPLYNRHQYRANRSEPTDYAINNGDGTWTAIGLTGGGATSGDSFRFSGDIVDMSVTGDVGELTLYLNGEEVSMDELVVEDHDHTVARHQIDDDRTPVESDETELVVAADNSSGLNYLFTSTGGITPQYDVGPYRANRSEPTDYAIRNDDGTYTAVGSVSGSGESRDTFTFEGDLIDFSADGDTDALTLYADGEEVSVDELTVDETDVQDPTETSPEDDESDDSDGDSSDDSNSDSDESDDSETPSGSDGDLSNHVIIDGSISDAIANYQIYVTGDIEPDESLSSVGSSHWDETDEVVDEGSVVGLVRNGIDGFRYSGEITAINIDGAVDVTIESSDL